MRSVGWHKLLGRLLVAGGLAALSPARPAGAALAVGFQPASPANQQAGPSAAAAAAAFEVAPAFQTFVNAHGSLRTFGAPISNDFLLLGKRVQVFERQVLELQADGSIAAMSLLDEGLPLTHVGGLTFPPADPAVAGALPRLGSDDYVEQASTAIAAGLLDENAPDDWNGLPANFAATFRRTVTCDDLAASSCDDTTLTRAALDVWGLPTSTPAADPADPDLVYVRFQRGIMQYSQADGQTQAVPLGTWFKRVLLGSDVPSDLVADVAGTRYYAQYAPNLPLGIARPSELPSTSLTAAFGSTSDLRAAGKFQAPGPTPPELAPALPDFGASSANATLTPTPALAPFAPAPPAGMVAIATPTVPPATFGDPALVPTPSPSAASAPQGPDPCAGDEQVMFAPRKPYAGTDVLIAATSARHHDARAVRLGGPIKTGQPNERPGLLGWVWEWTVSPTVEGWYEFSFYVDSARLCATAGFNALPSFGATPTATAAAQTTSIPTPSPTVTPTPTATVLAPPSLSSVSPESGNCNQVVFVQGQNFGYPQTQVSGQVFFVGPGGTRPAAVLGWGTTQITISIPAGSLASGVYNVIVQANGMASNSKTYTLLVACS